MRLKDIFEAPPERGPNRRPVTFNPDGTVAGPGQDARPRPITPIPGGARPEGPAAGMPRTAPGGARPEGPAAGMPRTAPGGTDASATQATVRAPGTTTSNLRRGSKGSDVSSLQQMLIDKGYDLGDTGADGKFGPRTAAAVKQFQTDFGLQVDGIAGDQTMSALNRAQGGARPTPASPGALPSSSNTATGGRGDGNAELQRRRGYQDGLAASRTTTSPSAVTPPGPGAGRSGIATGAPNTVRPSGPAAGMPAAKPITPGAGRSGIATGAPNTVRPSGPAAGMPAAPRSRRPI